MSDQAELFSTGEVDEFRTALERYGVWPITVWPCDLSDQKTRRLKELIGDLYFDTVRVGKGYKHAFASERAVLERQEGVEQTRLLDARTRCGTLTARDQFAKAAESKQRRADEERLERLGYGTTRAGAFTAPADNRSVYAGKVTASIFNPAVAAWLLNCFGPEPGATVFDPFAGGGTRAIMAAKAGYHYVGVELRLEEVQAVRARCERAGVAEATTIILGDARDREGIGRAWPGLLGRFAHFLLTCPPYWNLEQYEGGEGDLSMLPTYEDFLRELRVVIENTRRILHHGAVSCWVVGLHRDKDGTLLPLHHDVARLHAECGMRLREEIVLHQVNNGAIQRVGNFEKGKRRLVRVHEYALVFQR